MTVIPGRCEKIVGHRHCTHSTQWRPKRWTATGFLPSLEDSSTGYQRSGIIFSCSFQPVGLNIDRTVQIIGNGLSGSCITTCDLASCRFNLMSALKPGGGSR